MFIDTHAHLNFQAFANDRDEVIKRTLAHNVWLINVGSNYFTSQKAVQIAQGYENGVFACVGLHPLHCFAQDEQNVSLISQQLSSAKENEQEKLDINQYRELAKAKKVVGIGEIGLDYLHQPLHKAKAAIFQQKQKEAFLAQLQLAYELSLPVVLHCRKAHEDLIKTLSAFFLKRNLRHNYNGAQMKAVVHCFTGNWEQAQRYLEMGFYLGFNGIIFKMDLQKVIKKIPLERILIETDCPFLTPPILAEQRNEPLNVKYIAQSIAHIHNQPLEKIAHITTQNAQTLFNLS